MVTVRTYLNLAEAALAKSLLDDYEILCALIHENAHLYGRAPFAMPIRLVVDENQADQASCLLNGDLDGAAEIQDSATAAPSPSDGTPEELCNRNPWELLAIAFYFFLPGICVLQTKYPAAFSESRLVRREIAAVAVFHLLGWLAVIFAAFILALYLYVSRPSDRSKVPTMPN